jgi:hypothetical protein
VRVVGGEHRPGALFREGFTGNADDALREREGEFGRLCNEALLAALAEVEVPWYAKVGLSNGSLTAL